MALLSRLLLMMTLFGASAAMLVAQEKPGSIQKKAGPLLDTWRFVSIEQAGVVQLGRAPRRVDEPGRSANVERRTLMVNDDKFSVKQGERIIQSGKLAFDPTKAPKTIDLTVTEGEGKG
ncbi:MAG TPA: hypothetical protein VGP68_05900, partial [Gemmataceae bacterium]|nr:hypothetical protein [Gemmataceae bacterium]